MALNPNCNYNCDLVAQRTNNYITGNLQIIQAKSNVTCYPCVFWLAINANALFLIDENTFLITSKESIEKNIRKQIFVINFSD